MHIHIIGATILTISFFLYSFFCLDRIVAFARRIFSWNDNDIAWMMVPHLYSFHAIKLSDEWHIFANN